MHFDTMASGHPGVASGHPGATPGHQEPGHREGGGRKVVQYGAGISLHKRIDTISTKFKDHHNVTQV